MCRRYGQYSVLGWRGGRGRGSTSFYCFLFTIWRSNFDTLLHDTPKTSLSEIRSVPRCTGEGARHAFEPWLFYMVGSSHVWIWVQIWTKILLCEKVTTVLLDAQLVGEDLEEWVLEEKRECATSQLHQNQPLARTSTDFSSQSRSDSDIGVRAILTSEQFLSSMIFQSEWKRIWSPTRFLSRLYVLGWGPSLLFGQDQSGFSEVLRVKRKF